VIVERKDDIQKYFNLFKMLLGKAVSMYRITKTKDYAELESEKFIIKFIMKTSQARSWKAHYLLNLTQDKEYHDNFAEPMTIIHSMLDRTVWKELFE
jgi:hypothetical protein